ncbi:MAG: hypothetical protein RLY20_1093 [Verrucomicrobiota bacterium]|jgi:hypothetical protein
MSLYEPICETCDENSITALATEERHGVALCGSCAISQDEAAYERFLSDYYGGGGPVTLTEQCQAADRERQELRRRD